MRNDIKHWDLKAIISWLLEQSDKIEAIYLFGSRRYNTGSLRSDIDLLVCANSPLPQAKLLYPMHKLFPCVDLFETTDKRTARSFVNGSSIKTEGEITSALDAIRLWSREKEWSKEFGDWTQETTEHAAFVMSILPLHREEADVEFNYTKLLSDRNLPMTSLGLSWIEVANNICVVTESAVKRVKELRYKAQNINDQKLQITSEYDFQNLVSLVIGSWVPSIEREPPQIKFDQQKKVADFSLQRNRLVIEAKHIKDGNTKADVLKQLQGLRSFYETNTNVRCLLFLILVDGDVDLDEPKVEGEFSNRTTEIPCIVKCIRNSTH